MYTTLRSLAAVATVAVVATAGASCATRRIPTPEASAATAQVDTTVPPPPTLITFTNRSWTQAAVYVARQGGPAIRIGTVPAGNSATLTVPRDLVFGGTPLDFIARPLATRAAPRTGLVTVYPGDHLNIGLPPTHNLLSVTPLVVPDTSE